MTKENLKPDLSEQRLYGVTLLQVLALLGLLGICVNVLLHYFF